MRRKNLLQRKTVIEIAAPSEKSSSSTHVCFWHLSRASKRSARFTATRSNASFEVSRSRWTMIVEKLIFASSAHYRYVRIALERISSRRRFFSSFVKLVLCPNFFRQTSPLPLRRRNMVRKAYRCGRTLFVSSFQSSGVETVAPAKARNEYFGFLRQRMARFCCRNNLKSGVCETVFSKSMTAV